MLKQVQHDRFLVLLAPPKPYISNDFNLSNTPSRMSFGFGSSLSSFPSLSNGTIRFSHLPPHPHLSGHFPSGAIFLLPHSRHVTTSFAPDHFPLFASGSPSISIMSIAKSTTGALLMDVPTPNASTTPLSPNTSFSSSPPLA